MEGCRPACHRSPPSKVPPVSIDEFQRLQDQLYTEFPEIPRVTCDFKDLKSTSLSLLDQNYALIRRLLHLISITKASESSLQVLQLKGSNMTLTQTLDHYQQLILQLSHENEYYAQCLTALLEEKEGNTEAVRRVDREEEIRMLREQLRTRGKSKGLEERLGGEGKRETLREIEELFERQQANLAVEKWKNIDYAAFPTAPLEKTLHYLREALRLKDQAPATFPQKHTKSTKSLQISPSSRKERLSDASKSTAIPSISPAHTVNFTHKSLKITPEEQILRLETELALYKGKNRGKSIDVELVLREFAGKIGGKNVEKFIKDAVSKVEKSAFSLVTNKIVENAENKFNFANSKLQNALEKLKNLEENVEFGQKKVEKFDIGTSFTPENERKDAIYSFSESNPFETKRSYQKTGEKTESLGRYEENAPKLMSEMTARSQEKPIFVTKSSEKDTFEEKKSQEIDFLTAKIAKEDENSHEKAGKYSKNEGKLRKEIEELRLIAEERYKECEGLKQEVRRLAEDWEGRRKGENTEERRELERLLSGERDRNQGLRQEVEQGKKQLEVAGKEVEGLKKALREVIGQCQETMGKEKPQWERDDPETYLHLAESTKFSLSQSKPDPQQVLSRFETALDRCQSLTASLTKMTETTQSRLLHDNLDLERKVARQDIASDLPSSRDEVLKWVITKWQEAEEALTASKSARQQPKSSEKDDEIASLRQSLSQIKKQIAHKSHHRSTSNQQLKSLQMDLQTAEIRRLEQTQVIARLQAEAEYWQSQVKRGYADRENREVVVMQALVRLRDEVNKEGRGVVSPYDDTVGCIESITAYLQELKQRKTLSDLNERDLAQTRRIALQRESELLNEIRLLSQEKAALEVRAKAMSSPVGSTKPSLSLPEASDTVKQYYSL